jgi:hypothetical protein
MLKKDSPKAPFFLLDIDKVANEDDSISDVTK